MGWLFFTDVHCVVSYFNVGLQLLCFLPWLPGFLRVLVVWYHPKVSDAFGRRARVACPAVALCLGFCFMLRLAAISTGLWLFLESGSFIEYLLMFQCELAHSLTDSLCSEWFSSVPGAIVYFSKSPTIDLQYSHLNLYLISSNINKFLNHIIRQNNILHLIQRLFCL